MFVPISLSVPSSQLAAHAWEGSTHVCTGHFVSGSPEFALTIAAYTVLSNCVCWLSTAVPLCLAWLMLYRPASTAAASFNLFSLFSPTSI